MNWKSTVRRVAMSFASTGLRGSLRSRVLAGTAALLVGLLGPSVAQSQSLVPGAVAPGLRAERWPLGEAVTRYEPGRVYIVEFWATWCIPCHLAVPKLTDLTRRYPGLTVVGVAASEQASTTTRDDRYDLVQAYVDKRRHEIAYSIAFDSTGAMWNDWMVAAQRGGIPAAFIIGPDGRVVWIGNPLVPEFDRTIEAVMRRPDVRNTPRTVVGPAPRPAPVRVEAPIVSRDVPSPAPQPVLARPAPVVRPEREAAVAPVRSPAPRAESVTRAAPQPTTAVAQPSRSGPTVRRTPPNASMTKAASQQPARRVAAPAPGRSAAPPRSPSRESGAKRATEPQRSEVARSPAKRAEASRASSKKSEPTRTQSKRPETKRPETKRAETKRPEAKRAEATRSDAKRAEPKRTETRRPAPKAEERRRSDRSDRRD